MVSLLVFILVVFLIVYLALWMVGLLALPNPFNVVAQILILAIALVFILQKFGYANF